MTPWGGRGNGIFLVTNLDKEKKKMKEKTHLCS